MARANQESVTLRVSSASPVIRITHAFRYLSWRLVLVLACAAVLLTFALQLLAAAFERSVSIESTLLISLLAIGVVYVVGAGAGLSPAARWARRTAFVTLWSDHIDIVLRTGQTHATSWRWIERAWLRRRFIDIKAAGSPFSINLGVEYPASEAHRNRVIEWLRAHGKLA